MYQQFYRFHRQPFRLSSDPSFFFASQSHRRALAYLQYGLSQREGFVVITGDVGGGKTTVVSKLFESPETENIVKAKIVTTQLEAEDLLRLVAAGYGLPHHGISKAAVLRHIEEFLRNCAQQGVDVLLVVDEAQGLPRAAVEELRMLSNFQVRAQALLQIFLVGQGEFRNILRGEGLEQLRQRIIAAYHLAPFDADETRAYVEHRLTLAGWTNDPQFSGDAFAAVYRLTAGIPRRINTLCDRVLLFACLQDAHEVTAEMVAAVGEDIREEQGGRNATDCDQESDTPALQTLAPAPLPTAASARTGPLDERLHGLEASLAHLTAFVRDELGLLRQLASS
jgi:putative secretion ATPase (PEP-CTERM system associated)